MRHPALRVFLAMFFVLAALTLVSRRVARAQRPAKEAAAAQIAADKSARKIADFALSDAQNRTWSLRDAKAPVVVVTFLGTECPLAKLYAPRLTALAEKYSPRGVTFVAINANSQDSLAEMTAYAKQHGLTMPLLKDVGNRVADQFAAERTPQTFVLDNERRVRYQGRIDDQYGIGYARDEATRQDLAAALDELLAGKSVSVALTEPVGCHIGRVHEPDEKSPVTYSNQIARILAKRCVECHRPGEIGPFSLTDYDEVAGWAETLAEAVQAERMPPWHASAKHGKFADDRRLSAEEKRMIRDWVAAGAPRGDAKDLPKELAKSATVAKAASGSKSAGSAWQIPGEPDLVVAMSDEPFVVKAEGDVRYQFFTVDPGFTEDRWVRAFEVQPGNRAVVHHTLVFARGAGASPLDPIGGFLAAYVPGMRAKAYPSGMAKRIPAGSKLVFQMHYTPNGSTQRDITRLGLWFAKESDIEREVHTVSSATRDIAIPPGASNHPVEARSRAIPANALLLAMMPHMHVRGKSFRYELHGRGNEEILLDIPRYDFNWQTAYRLAEPLPLPAGATIQASATYDNSADNPNNPDPKATVRWGDQTYEEMMIGYFDIAVPKGQSAGGGAAALLGAAGDAVARLDKNNDGQIARDEVPERWQRLFDRIARGRDQVPLAEVRKSLENLRGLAP